jgi:hypothetical protein
VYVFLGVCEFVCVYVHSSTYFDHSV